MAHAEPEEIAKRNHVIPPLMLLHAMKSIIEGKKEDEFLQTFKNSFVLASEQDVRDLKAFLARHGDQQSISTQMVVGADRC